MMEENEHIPILVEGPHDIQALRQMGFEGELLVINTGDSMILLCEKIASLYRELIILTDFDRKGGELLRRLEALLSSQGVRCHAEYRARLMSVLGSRISEIEELPSLLGEKII